MFHLRYWPSRQSLTRLLRQFSLNDLALVLTIAVVGMMMLSG